MTASRSERPDSTRPFWITAFLDAPASEATSAVDFWSGVTGYADRRSEQWPEDVVLEPLVGDSVLCVQALGEGSARVHLDLHVTSPREAADRALRLGATEQPTPDDADWIILSSPGGFPFCFVPDAATDRPEPSPWPEGASILDQVCLDIGPSEYDAECEFWSEITGWALNASPVAPEFRNLTRPAGQPYRFLLQRIGDERSEVTAHLDFASANRTAETDRHVTLGARVRTRTRYFTVLADPTGLAYCITDRDPETGLLILDGDH